MTDSINTVAIVAGQSLSGPVLGLSNAIAVTIGMPPDWTPAVLTFQASPNGRIFFDAFSHDGQELAVNVVSNTIVALPTDSVLVRSAAIRLRSGTRANPVPQADERTFFFTIIT